MFLLNAFDTCILHKHNIRCLLLLEPIASLFAEPYSLHRLQEISHFFSSTKI